jgi:hypothetical protein
MGRDDRGGEAAIFGNRLPLLNQRRRRAAPSNKALRPAPPECRGSSRAVEGFEVVPYGSPPSHDLRRNRREKLMLGCSDCLFASHHLTSIVAYPGSMVA